MDGLHQLELEGGWVGGVMALNAIARSWLSKDEGGDADERAPRHSERGRGWKSADRRALPRSERGRRAARGGGRAGHATRPHACCGSWGVGVGGWAANGPRPGRERVGKLGQGLGCARFGVGGGNKRKTLLKF